MRLRDLFEGRVKNLAIDAEFDRLNKKPSPQQFKVMVNGRVWLRDGKPVTFNSHSSATKAADTISSRKNITTQVLPL